MNVAPILNKIVTRATSSIHTARREALKATLSRLMHGSSANVTCIGRGITGQAYEKHRIKRADRLLSNAHLQHESMGIYQSLVGLTLKRHALNRNGQPKRSKTAHHYRTSAKEPWLLSTSLPLGPTLAKRVVKLYRLRMQIEKGFRDMKSHRFGQGFEYNKTKNIKRLAILILLTTLTHWLLMLLGLAATLVNRHRRYQANSIKHARVLSLHFIGGRVAVDSTVHLS